jgi:hypothetical protein
MSLAADSCIVAPCPHPFHLLQAKGASRSRLGLSLVDAASALRKGGGGGGMPAAPGPQLGEAESDLGGSRDLVMARTK